jgi:hypothetical protein
MLLPSFAVAPIVIDVEVLARPRERRVAQIIADQPEIYLLIGHVGTRAMPEPMG